MNDNDNDNAQDDARDAHLLAALRHAPDRHAVPPREVSERILAAARAAVRPAREVRAPWWQRWLARLMQPQVAAAFGTLAVASLVGVMWSTREPPVVEFLPPPSVERAAQGAAAPTPPAEPKADAANEESSASRMVGASAASVESRAKIATAPPKPAPGRDAAARTESRSRAAAEAPAFTSAASTAGTATATATPSAESPPAAAPAPEAADAAGPAPMAERRAANERDSQVLARQQGAASGRTDSAAALTAAPAAKARPAADPLASVDRLLAPSPERMVWAGAGRQSAHEAAQAAWWSRLKQATSGAWQAQPRVPSPSSQPWLTLSMAGAPVATIDLFADSVLFCAAEGDACWRAPITPAQRDAWMTEVARW